MNLISLSVNLSRQTCQNRRTKPNKQPPRAGRLLVSCRQGIEPTDTERGAFLSEAERTEETAANQQSRRGLNPRWNTSFER